MFEANDLKVIRLFFLVLAQMQALFAVCSMKIVTQNWGIDLLFAKFMLPLRWNQNQPVIERCFEP